jgi:hypothetical protein
MPGIDLIALVSNKLLFQNGSQMRAEKYVRESFDEPLTKEQVLAIAGPFVK